MLPDPNPARLVSPSPAGRGWAYAGAVLGGVVSIAANIAHSYVPPVGAPAGWSPEPGAVIGAVFWPVAVVVAVEILARTAWPSGRWWLVLRFAGLLPVAVVAAMVSYRHLSGLLAFYGEDVITSRVGPLAVDGLMVMASGALIASAARRGSPAVSGSAAQAAPPEVAPAVPVANQVTAPTPEPDTDSAPVTPRPATRPARVPVRPGTAEAVARLRRRHPDLPSVEIARRLGVSDRTVRRHLAATRAESSDATPTDIRTDPAADAAPVAA